MIYDTCVYVVCASTSFTSFLLFIHSWFLVLAFLVHSDFLPLLNNTYIDGYQEISKYINIYIERVRNKTTNVARTGAANCMYICVYDLRYCLSTFGLFSNVHVLRDR